MQTPSKPRVKRVKVRFSSPGVDFRVIEVGGDGEKIEKLIWSAANDFTLAIVPNPALMAIFESDPDFEVMG